MVSRSSAKRLIIGAVVALLAACAKSPLPPVTPEGVPGTASTSGFRTIYSFGPDYPTGLFPSAGLIVNKGALFSTTDQGGPGIWGTVFKVTTSGAERVLYGFKGLPYDGNSPDYGVTAVANDYYGTTVFGGASLCYLSGSPSRFLVGCGTVFKVSGFGTETVLHRFNAGKDGAWPAGGLTLLNGTLYGATAYGGRGRCQDIQYYHGCGIVFSVSTSGKERVLYDFKGAASGPDGAYPQGNLTTYKGLLYGVTSNGGTCCGTVFSITPAGQEKVLYRFKGDKSDGGRPNGGLTVVHGVLYGTTQVNGSGFVGTAFSLTTAGKERVLYNFQGGQDGASPNGGLIYVNGELYGTTNHGGGSGCRSSSGSGCGIIFKMTLSGDETVLHRFARGGLPNAGLADLNGSLYGTTNDGGKHRKGSVFRIPP
ncbi:MAG TPA: choice-of-anchor tandem repeat GloVer-containing protein [Candidatus Binatia bacterium]|nr:choice-of-anchor tandem repeat GloVer-containing protein [Candidatus Binatia bacterium]